MKRGTRIVLGSSIVLACATGTLFSSQLLAGVSSLRARVGSPIAGSRLKVRRLVMADGATEVLGFRDTELGVDCSMRLSADGSKRCLPEKTLPSFAYADDRCTQSIGIYETNCDIPAYGSRIESKQTASGKEVMVRLFALGEIVPAPSPLYVLMNGSCQQGARMPSDVGYVLLGEEVSPSRFVPGTESVQ